MKWTRGGRDTPLVLYAFPSPLLPPAQPTSRGSDATHQVAEGARSIGYGEIGSGVSDLVVGIGRTIVEGTVYTGKTIGEFSRTRSAANRTGRRP